MTQKKRDIWKNGDLNMNLCILSARACSAGLEDIERLFRKQKLAEKLILSRFCEM